MQGDTHAADATKPTLPPRQLRSRLHRDQLPPPRCALLTAPLCLSAAVDRVCVAQSGHASKKRRNDAGMAAPASPQPASPAAAAAAASASAASPSSAGGSGGKPRHQRQWTHSQLDGTKEARLHRRMRTASSGNAAGAGAAAAAAAEEEANSSDEDAAAAAAGGDADADDAGPGVQDEDDGAREIVAGESSDDEEDNPNTAANAAAAAAAAASSSSDSSDSDSDDSSAAAGGEPLDPSAALLAKQTTTLRFRNYTPHDATLKVAKIPPYDINKGHTPNTHPTTTAPAASKSDQSQRCQVRRVTNSTAMRVRRSAKALRTQRQRCVVQGAAQALRPLRTHALMALFLVCLYVCVFRQRVDGR